MQLPFRGDLSPSHPVRSTAKNFNPSLALREGKEPHPHYAGINHTDGPGIDGRIGTGKRG